jgi:hypothetical protein
LGVAIRTAAVVVFWSLLSATTVAQSADPRDALRGAMAEFLARHVSTETGGVVLLKGIGSWVDERSPTFRNPLEEMAGASDMDLTLVVAGLTPTEAAAFWKRAQSEIRSGFRTRLEALGVGDSQIARLDREFLTIYPPRQVVSDVSDLEEANALFRELNLWPKPDQSGEGLYGEAGVAWTQNFESTSGRAFFVHPASGRLIAGDTGLAHIIEGHGRWTLRSTSGLAEQLVDRVLAAIDADDPVAAVKQFKRLTLVMGKARSLGRVPPDSTLDNLVASLDLGDPEQREAYTASARTWLDRHRREMARVLDDSRGEARLLRDLAERWGGRPIPLGRVERILASARFGPLRTQALEWAAATGRTVGPVFRALLISTAIAAMTLEAEALVQTAADQGLSRATVEAFMATVRFLNLPAELAEGVLVEVRAQGIGLVTRFQDCEDLVAGVFSVKGRERVGDGYQVDELARRFAYTDDVVRVVERKAWQAASRGWTTDLSRQQASVETQLEQDVAESLTARCVPPILTAWDTARRRLLDEVWESRTRLAERLAQTVMVLQHDDGAVRMVDSLDRASARRHVDAMVGALERMNEGAGPAGAPVVRSWRMTTVVTWVVAGVPDTATTVVTLLGGEAFDPFEAVRAPRQSEAADVTLTVVITVEPAALVGDLYDPPTSLESVARPLLAVTQTLAASLRPMDRGALEVTGYVTSRLTGAPVPGATVVLVGTRTHVATAGTDGRVAVTGLFAGDYQIEISHPGFVTRRAPLRVRRSLRNGTFALTPIDVRSAAPTPPVPAAAPPPPAVPTPTSRTLTFAEAYVPIATTPTPQSFTVEVPGPGTLTIAIEYHQPAVVVTNYGAFRQEAWVRWTAPGVSGGLSAGSSVTNRGGQMVSEPTRKVATVAVPGAATLTLAVMPEVTIAYQWNGKWVDLTTRSWATHHHLHAATATITLTFTPAR